MDVIQCGLFYGTAIINVLLDIFQDVNFIIGIEFSKAKARNIFFKSYDSEI